jgi:hypothetical protein
MSDDEKAARTRNAPMKKLAEKFRARRGKKKVWQRRPTLARCPFPGCEEMINTFFCATHWPLVDKDTKRALIKAVRELKFHGGRRPDADVLELFEKAIHEVATRLYKQGAKHGAQHLDGNVSPVRSNLGVQQEVPPAAQPGGAQAGAQRRDGPGQLIALPTREQVEEFGQGGGARGGPELPPGPEEG